MSRRPDFDDLVGRDVPADEREQLMRAHDLLVAADPPAELSPELEAVPWPEEALTPILPARRPRRRRPVLAFALVATAAFVGFLIGQATNSDTTINTVRAVQLHGTALDRNALATLKLGKKDPNGNWPMVLRVTGLDELPEGGYYDLYLTKHGKPIAKCGVFNVGPRVTVVRLSASYDLSHFDRNGWVVTRQMPGQHKPTDIVLRPSA